jgi:ribosome-binding protein aMBF1 (putative translation factor)
MTVPAPVRGVPLTMNRVLGVLRMRDTNHVMAKKRTNGKTHPARTDIEAIYARIGERIKELREERKWSRADLAGKCGVTVPALWYMESGKRRVSLTDIETFAEIFGLPVRKFLKGIWF